MDPIVQLYWLRVALAVVAAALSAALALTFGVSAETYNINILLNCISIALLVYLVSYYVLRAKFKKTIEPQSKIATTGIGMYFFAWLAFLVLFYTLLTQV